MRRHIVPVSRPGELRSTLPAASATASGATAPSAVKPVGVSTSVSSATWVCTNRLAPVSWSTAEIPTSVVCGSAPTCPTIAANASLVSVPTLWPAAANLYEPPVIAAFGSLTTLNTYASWSSRLRAPALSKLWPKAQTRPTSV